MTQSDGITGFLTTRLDEDEAMANRGFLMASRPEGFTGLYRETVASLHDLLKARVLREVAAKRAILAMWQEPETESHLPTGEPVAQVAVAEAIGSVVRVLAAVYSDHPDYRPEWAPQ